MSVVGIGRNNPPEPIEPQQSPPPIMPGALLCSLPQAATMISRGTRFVYEAIATGKIRAVKSDKRTLVVVASLHEYVAGLPSAKIKPLTPPSRR
jgi:hypothetical protein